MCGWENNTKLDRTEMGGESMGFVMGGESMGFVMGGENMGFVI